MKHPIKTGLLSIIATAFMMPQGADAAVIYDFAGTCSYGCTGTISGVLRLDDAYTPGSAIAETSDTGGVFISFERYLNGALELSIDASDYAIVAGTADPFFGVTAAGDGLLPALAGVSSVADVYIVSRDAMVGFNDYMHPAGVFNTEHVEGVGGKWTLRAVPAPAAVWLFGTGLIGLFSIGLTRNARTV